nr:MAG TPA: Chromatin remodeling complex ATPase [Caudoviricetes sp.]
MKNGCILNGGTGSGKSITALAYYFYNNGGIFSHGYYIPMPDDGEGNPPDLYIITTAHKRDTREWDGDMINFLLSTDPSINIYSNTVVVDSWNNIHKYTEVKNAFFIFDEQRTVGRGTWAKSFIKIAKSNEWVLLTATPGDKWPDYIPIFIANGFYKNRTEFNRRHIVYSAFSSYPKIDRYVDTGRLIRLRDSILINMDVQRHTVQHHLYISVEYSKDTYKDIQKNRWNYTKDEPIQNASELCYELRKCVNGDLSRIDSIIDILHERKKAIIFYNFDYERDILLEYLPKLCTVAEWNGHKHQELPEGDNWAYLVQYTAGCEGWNCIKTDTIIFYSQNYSYKTMMQAIGRIDRLNTPFIDLYYYHLKSKAPIDLAIGRALAQKKKFNETKWVGSFA